VAHLVHLERLLHLSLDRTRVTDRALEKLNEVPVLRSLSIEECLVSDAGITALAQSESVIDLRLSRTPIGDAAMQALRRLRSLRSVSIDGTCVTSRGVLCLGDLKHLRSIAVTLNDSTRTGIKELAHARPDIEWRIVRE
jgi:hypothetical protein